MPSKVSLINLLHDIATVSPLAVQPMGLTYIASVLLQDYDVEILDANLLNMGTDRVAGHIDRANMDYVGGI